MVNFEAYFSGTYFLVVSVGRSVAAAVGRCCSWSLCLAIGCPAASNIILYINYIVIYHPAAIGCPAVIGAAADDP